MKASSPRTEGGLFELHFNGTTACTGATPTISQVTFYYSMYGAAMGTLQLLACMTEMGPSSCLASVWSKSGDQGNTWQQASVALGTTSFLVRGIRGSDYTSDAAVDSALTAQGASCPGGAASPANCSAGTFAEEPRQAKCSKCVAGDFQDLEGATECKVKGVDSRYLGNLYIIAACTVPE